MISKANVIDPKIKSIAVPGLGSGGCGIPAEEMAELFKGVLQSVACAPYLRTVKFILENQDMEQAYLKVFAGSSYSNLASSSAASALLPLNKALGAEYGRNEVKLISFAEKVVLSVVSDKGASVDSVIKKVKAIAADNCAPNTFPTTLVDSLGAAEIRALNELCLEFEVNVKVDKRKKELFLEGRQVPTALVKLHSLISEWQRKCPDLKGAGIEWFYEDPVPGWQRYSDLIACQLEKAYKAGNSSVTLDDGGNSTKSKAATYTVDFVQWMEVVSNRSGQNIQKLQVKRRSPRDLVPLHWNSDESSVGVSVVEVSSSGSEYRDVVTRANITPKIVKVERVENVTLYKQYLAQKAVVEKEVPPRVLAEMILYHGTKQDVLQKINKEGFNRSFAGTNVGQAYGAGNYFAKEFSLSYQGYAKPNSDGHRKVYQARVLTGYYTGGSAGMRTAPDRSDGTGGRFHSTVDNQSNPRIFVTYLDAHAYPEYIITVQ